MKTLTAILIALLLTACGGGEATEQEKAEADDAKMTQPAPPLCAPNPEVCK